MFKTWEKENISSKLLYLSIDMLYHKVDLFSKWMESHFCLKKSLLQDKSLSVTYYSKLGEIILFVSPSEALTTGQCWFWHWTTFMKKNSKKKKK